jgi:hypothetical protein
VSLCRRDGEIRPTTAERVSIDVTRFTRVTRPANLRAWKYDLIRSINPVWRDLAEDFGFDPLPLK